jgi:hypothetical protein
MEQCNKLSKKDIIKCCEDFYKKNNIDIKALVDEDEVIEDDTEEVKKNALSNKKKYRNFLKEQYGNPLEDKNFMEDMIKVVEKKANRFKILKK